MNPALLRFLNILKEKLRQSLEKINPELAMLSPVINLKKLLTDFTNNENIDNEAATKFITGFYQSKRDLQTFFRNNPSVASSVVPKKAALLFTELENNEIYILNLLLHKNKGNQEFNLSSFAEHFHTFLKCPFSVGLEHDQLKFVLSYSKDDTVREKQREHSERFYRALWHLGIEPHTISSEDGKKVTITIPPNHVNDMLQLAQFELIDEDNIPKEIPVLEQKFRNILTELIQTEVSFSIQCGKMAGLLAAKLKLPECKLTESERELLTQAQAYYQEITDNPYPWFGEKFNAEQLKPMSFDDMLQLCHGLYEGLQSNANGKAEEIGKRLAIMRWASIQYAELNRIINNENRLNFPDDGSRESEKQVATQNLIPPVQRLPRIILLTGELVKCVNVVAINKLDGQKAAYLGELQALNEEWMRAAQRTNEMVKDAEKNSSDSIVRRIFQSFNQLPSQFQSIELSASLFTHSITNHFAQLRRFITQPIFGNIEAELDDKDFILVEENKLGIPANFHDDLTRSVIFAQGTVSIFTTIEESPERSAQAIYMKHYSNSAAGIMGSLVDRRALNKSNKSHKNFDEEIDSALLSPTLSQIGGFIAVFSGIVLIAAGVVLTLLQPHLFVIGIALIWEGCVVLGIGAMLLKEKPTPIDYDKDPNKPHFFCIDVEKSGPTNEASKPHPSPLNNQTPHHSDDSYSDDDVPRVTKKK